VLGAPFLAMGRVHGNAAPDLPPYVFGGWLTELSRTELDGLERALVDMLAGIHGVALDDEDARLLDFPLTGRSPLHRHVGNQRRYYEWIRQQSDVDFPIIERAFAWLERRWPSNEDDRALSWGDARLANVLFDGLRPVAVLDWEAAAVGPRELDIGWFLFFHQYYQRVADRYGYTGLPTFLDRRRIADDYERRTGHTIVDLDWYLVYAELRQALTSIRVSSRAVHFGERATPADPQDLIMDRTHLEEVLETT
jgi:aminoglycoside phosphotransferase (APT) family kinase protein